MNDYKYLTKTEALVIMNSYEMEISEIIMFDHRNDLTDHEKVFPNLASESLLQVKCPFLLTLH